MVIKRNFKNLPRSHLYWFPIIYTIELLRNVSLIDVNFLFSDENECYILKPCQHDGICINNNGSYVCNCSKGWQGHDCEEGTEQLFSDIVMSLTDHVILLILLVEIPVYCFRCWWMSNV